MKYLADIPLGPDGGFKPPGSGPLSNPTADAPGTLTKIISTSVGTITAVAFIYFTIKIFMGALSIITAGSDKGKIEGARKDISNSLIGLVIIVSAIFLIDIVSIILNIPILNISLLIDLITK
jgi:hypothetical protein